MAGTNHRRSAVTGGPAIILVEPQLGENIGTAARAMLNCGLDDLRLVRPRDGWPSEKAVAAASGADTVLENARLYPSVAAAISDLVHVFAATARDRGMVRREVTPRRRRARRASRRPRGAASPRGEPCPDRARLQQRHGQGRISPPRRSGRAAPFPTRCRRRSRQRPPFLKASRRAAAPAADRRARNSAWPVPPCRYSRRAVAPPG